MLDNVGDLDNNWVAFFRSIDCLCIEFDCGYSL